MSNPSNQGRRGMLQASAAGMAGLTGLGVLGPTHVAAASDSVLDLSSDAGRFTAHMKLLGNLKGGRTYVSFSGTLWGIAPESQPAPLCGLSGLVRQDWTRGENGAHRLHSFDLGYFSDLETGQPVDEITNPITREKIQPYHYKYGGGITEYSELGTRLIKPDANKVDLTPYDGQWSTAADHVWFNDRNAGQAPSPLDRELWQRQRHSAHHVEVCSNRAAQLL